MKKLLDLRFVIGVFFSVVGALLMLYVLSSKQSGDSSVNTWCGIIFLLFGIAMIALSYLNKIEEE